MSQRLNMNFFPTVDENGRQGNYELKLYRYEASLTNKPAECKYNECPHPDNKIKGKELKICYLKRSPTVHKRHPFWFHVDCFFKVCKPKQLSDIAKISSLSIQNQHFIEQKIEQNPYSTCSVGKPSRMGKPAVCQICGSSVRNKNKREGLCVRVHIDYSIYALHYGPVRVLWQFHPKCFNRAKYVLGFENQLTERMQGFNELSVTEKNTLLHEIPNSQSAVVGTTTTNGAGVTVTNGHTQEELDLLAQLEHWRNIFKKMKSPDTNELAKVNNQREKRFIKQVPQAEFDLIDRLADCATFGALETCLKCRNGALLFYNDRYICTGNPIIGGQTCAYTDCAQEYIRPPRTLFYIPEEIVQKYPHLEIVSGATLNAPRVRPIRFPPDSDLSESLSQFSFRDESDIEIQNIIEELLTREPRRNFQRIHVQNGCPVDPGFKFLRTTTPRLELTPNCVHVYQPEADYEMLPPPKPYSAYLIKTSSRRDLSILCKLQLLVPHRHLLEQIYIVFQSYGLIGYRDADKKSPNHNVIATSDLAQAIQRYEDAYYSLTGNSWTSGRFEKKPNKYTCVGTNFNGQHINNLNWSTTLSDPVQYLLQNIFDKNLIRNFLIEYDLDISAMPLGILDPKELHRAKSLLNELSQLLNNYTRGSNLHVIQLSEKFHSIIPHDLKNGTRQVPLLNSMDSLQRMYNLMDNLEHIGRNYSLTVGDNINRMDMDSTYAQLGCMIEHLLTTSEAHMFIKNYIESSWVTHVQGSTLPSSKYIPNVLNTFQITTNAGWNQMPTTGCESQWLMHGTKPFCIPGILKHGLKCGSPTPGLSSGGDGQFFGHGIYFSDISTKCAEYCSFQENGHIAYLLICEVAPQNIVTVRECVNGNPDHYRNLGHDFVHCLGGLVQPSRQQYLDRSDGSRVRIPLGPLEIIRTLFNNPRHQFKEGVYVLYDEKRVVIRYIAQVKLDRLY